jgi:hypothetical protein
MCTWLSFRPPVSLWVGFRVRSVSFGPEEGNWNYYTQILTMIRRCAKRRFGLSQVKVHTYSLCININFLRPLFIFWTDCRALNLFGRNIYITEMICKAQFWDTSGQGHIHSKPLYVFILQRKITINLLICFLPIYMLPPFFPKSITLYGFSFSFFYQTLCF